jgi:integrase
MHFSINKDSRGFRLFVTHTDGRRKSLRLQSFGISSKQQADGFRQVILALVAQKTAGIGLDERSLRLVQGLHPRLRGFLQEVGLLSQCRRSLLVHEYVTSFRNRKAALVAPSTMKVIGRTLDRAMQFFHPNELLASVTADRAIQFRQWLVPQRGKQNPVLAEATIRKTCAIMSEVFTAAVRERLLFENPFNTAGIKKAVRPNRAREYFVSREEAERLLDACEGSEERLMVGLARFGGLRMPSEIHDLRWKDFDPAARTLTIRSPKTAHHESGGIRKIPVFPTLMALLEEHRLSVCDSDYLMPTLRVYPSLSVRMRRIIRSSGITDYPRAMHNLRLSCISEWVVGERRDLVTVSEWAGHTIQVMSQHYLRQIHADSASRAALEAASSSGAGVG